jgi:hypothetical protein
MPGIEREREVPAAPLGPEELGRRREQGWRAAVVEWEREVPGESEGPDGGRIDVPFGYRVAPGCVQLEEDPAEVGVLAAVMAPAAERAVARAKSSICCRSLSRRALASSRAGIGPPGGGT